MFDDDKLLDEIRSIHAGGEPVRSFPQLFPAVDGRGTPDAVAIMDNLSLIHISITGFAVLRQVYRYKNNSDIGPIAGRGFENVMRLN